LETAWCDAAYWLREGLAEPIDSIAVAKLETALEVFLCSENSKESRARLIESMNVFFGLEPDQHARTYSEITVAQFAHGFVTDRSRVLHGTWSTLNARLSGSRTALEDLATMVLRAGAIEIETYVASSAPLDNLNSFLGWVKRQRAPTASPSGR
jgi:hypothetical protein